MAAAQSDRAWAVECLIGAGAHMNAANKVEWSAVECSVVECSEVECSEVERSGVEWSGVEWIVVFCSAVQ